MGLKTHSEALHVITGSILFISSHIITALANYFDFMIMRDRLLCCLQTILQG